MTLNAFLRRWFPFLFGGKVRWIVLGFVILLIGFRIALPFIVKNYVNKTLNELEGYRGHVNDVDINLWRGAYQIEGIVIDKVSGDVPVPFVSASLLDLSIEWSALFDGSLVGEIEFNELKINFVQGPSEAQSQAGGGNDFAQTAKDLFPLRINRFDVNDGEVHFQNFHTDPKVDIFLDSLFVHATNLTNSRGLSDSLVATIEATGKAMGTGRLGGVLQIDPYTELPTFSLDVKLENVNLTEMNSFFEAYANVDVESGTFGVYSEIAARNGSFVGYVKPLFKDMTLIDLEEDTKQPLKFLWELIVEAASKLFTNPPEEQLGTTIPLSGNLDDPNVDILSTLGGLLRNAFIKALQPGIEGRIALKTVPGE